MIRFRCAAILNSLAHTVSDKSVLLNRWCKNEREIHPTKGMHTLLWNILMVSTRVSRILQKKNCTACYQTTLVLLRGKCMVRGASMNEMTQKKM